MIRLSEIEESPLESLIITLSKSELKLILSFLRRKSMDDTLPDLIMIVDTQRKVLTFNLFLNKTRSELKTLTFDKFEMDLRNNILESPLKSYLSKENLLIKLSVIPEAASHFSIIFYSDKKFTIFTEVFFDFKMCIGNCQLFQPLEDVNENNFFIRCPEKEYISWSFSLVEKISKKFKKYINFYEKKLKGNQYNFSIEKKENGRVCCMIFESRDSCVRKLFYVQKENENSVNKKIFYPLEFISEYLKTLDSKVKILNFVIDITNCLTITHEDKAALKGKFECIASRNLDDDN